MSVIDLEARVKPAYITDEKTGEQYELDFNRESVVFAERSGFKIDELLDFPATLVPDFFYYAFRMHHRKLSRDKVDKLRESWGGIPISLLRRLTELYQQARLKTVILDDEEAEKNAEVSLNLPE